MPSDVRARHHEPGHDIFSRDSRVLQNKAHYPALQIFIKVPGYFLIPVGTGTLIDVVSFPPGVLLSNDHPYPAQHPYMVTGGPYIHAQRPRERPHTTARVLPDAHIHRVSRLVFKDVPIRNSLMAEAQPYKQRKQDLYRDNEHRSGHANKPEDKDAQGFVPDV